LKNTLERRPKLLNMEGLGFSRYEITKELTTLFDCTPRTILYDFKNRGKWQPLLEQYDPKTSLLKIINRLNTIYRKACFKLLQSQNEMVQLGALRIMLESSKALVDVTIPDDVKEEQFRPEKIVLRWQQGKSVEDLLRQYKDILERVNGINVDQHLHPQYDWAKLTEEDQKIFEKHRAILERIKVTKDNPRTSIH